MISIASTFSNVAYPLPPFIQNRPDGSEQENNVGGATPSRQANDVSNAGLTVIGQNDKDAINANDQKTGLTGSTATLGGASAIAAQEQSSDQQSQDNGKNNNGQNQQSQQQSLADETEEDKTSNERAIGNDLTEEEKDQVEELKARDQEVRTHEQAHKAKGGSLTGPIQYEFEQGPDGNQYAVGGSVNIDTSPVPNDPQATIDKMRIVQAAALAPLEPSGADRSVAAQAQATEQQASAELRKQQAEERQALLDNNDNSENGTQTIDLLSNSSSNNENKNNSRFNGNNNTGFNGKNNQDQTNAEERSAKTTTPFQSNELSPNDVSSFAQAYQQAASFANSQQPQQTNNQLPKKNSTSVTQNSSETSSAQGPQSSSAPFHAAVVSGPNISKLQQTSINIFA